MSMRQNSVLHHVTAGFWGSLAGAMKLTISLKSGLIWSQNSKEYVVGRESKLELHKKKKQEKRSQTIHISKII